MIDMTRKHGLVIIENPLIPFKGYKLINLCGLIFCRRGVADAITETDANHEGIHTEQQKCFHLFLTKRVYILIYHAVTASPITMTPSIL